MVKVGQAVAPWEASPPGPTSVSEWMWGSFAVAGLRTIERRNEKWINESSLLEAFIQWACLDEGVANALLRQLSRASSIEGGYGDDDDDE